MSSSVNNGFWRKKSYKYNICPSNEGQLNADCIQKNLSAIECGKLNTSDQWYVEAMSTNRNVQIYNQTSIFSQASFENSIFGV